MPQASRCSMVPSRSTSERPSSIDGPRHHKIEFATAGILEQGVKARPLITTFGATDPEVSIDLDDIPSATLGNRFELADLVLNRLMVRRDSHVQCGALCWLRHGVALACERSPFPRDPCALQKGGSWRSTSVAQQRSPIVGVLSAAHCFQNISNCSHQANSMTFPCQVTSRSCWARAI